MNQSFMKEKPVFPLLTSMALPMVISMLVNSLYNIIDSFFVAQISEQAMTALSLVYPVQNLINAIAIGFGVGMNALIALCLGAGDVKNADRAATHGMLFSIVHGIVITVVSIGIMPFFLSLFTKDTEVLQLGTRYASIAFSFSLIIMLGLAFEKIFQAVGNMKITMAALLCGCITNIILDPLLIFGIGFLPRLGIAGAALATAFCPVVTMLVCSTHYLSKKCNIGFKWKRLSLRHLISCCQLGVSAFVGEISSAVITFIFNMLILGLTGSTGVAAYGVVANMSLVGMAIMNGMSQGAQPLISESFGKGAADDVKKLLSWALKSVVAVEIILVALVWIFTDPFIAVFNSENNRLLLEYAHTGLRLYFLGFLFAGVNIMLVAYFSATANARPAIIGSLLRGAVAIGACAIVLSMIWGMNGVWLSFLTSEIITFAVLLILGRNKESRKMNEYV